MGLYLSILLLIAILVSKHKIGTFITVTLILLPFIDFSLFANIAKIKVFDILTLCILPFYLNSHYFKNLPNKKVTLRIAFLLIGILFFSSLLSLDIQNSLINLITFSNYIIFFLILISFINKKNNFVNILKQLIYSSLISLGVLSMQLFIGIDISLYSELNQNVFQYEQIRYTGPFHDPQKFGQYLSCLFFIGLAYFSYYKGKSLFTMLFLFVIIIAIGMTGSRGPLLGFIFAISFVFIKFLLVQKQFFKTIIIGFLIFLGSNLLSSTFAFKRLTSNRLEEDANFRYEIWLKALKILSDNPFFGIGPGSYQNYVAKHDRSQFWVIGNEEKMYFDHPESNYLLWLVEYGLIAFLILMIIILLIFNPFKKTNSLLNLKSSTYLEAGLFSLLVGFVSIYSLGDKRIGIVFFTLLAILYVGKYTQRQVNHSIKK